MNFINYVRSARNEYKTRPRYRCFTRPFSPPQVVTKRVVPVRLGKKGLAARKVFHLEVDGVRNGQAFAAPKRPAVITSCLRGEI